MKTETLLNIETQLNGENVRVNTLPSELQADYLVSTAFSFFISRQNKLWRIENLYYIITKDGTKALFKLNRAQRDFVEKYLFAPKPYKRLIILKARQLGFTTLISLWFLDEIIFNPNTEALQIAHTLKDAGELFNRKISFAVKNLYPCVEELLTQSQKSAKKIQFEYEDETGGKSMSSFTVSNSGRSGTNHLLHISELGKLAKLYLGRAEEIVTGTLPSVPANGTAIIESTAEGQSGLFWEMYSKAMKRRPFITPELSSIEFYPVFYNWTWDDAEIERTIQQTGIIAISQMKECEIDWQEYKDEHQLSDKEISFYYAKFIALNEDIDKLHQEYPTTEMEAFIGSGSNYFSLRKTAELYEKCNDNYKRYDYINGEFIENEKGPLYVYEEPQPGRVYVIGGDVAEGLLDGDFSTAVVLGYDKNVKALFQGHLEPDEYSKMVQKLGTWYNRALLAIEFNKDGNWVNTDLQVCGYTNLYIRVAVDDITKVVTKSYGWLTSKKTRDMMLGEAKKHFNATKELNCRPLLEEIMSFVRDKRGKPSAAPKKHDDIVIAWCIAVAVLQGKKETIQQNQGKTLMQVIFNQ